MPTIDKHVLIPKPVRIAGFDFTHKMLVIHFLDTAKLFQSRSGARIGGKILDAIEASEKAELWYYTLTTDQWKFLRDIAEDDETDLPVITQQRTNAAGMPVGEPEAMKIGAVHFVRLIDPIDGATSQIPEAPVAEPVASNSEAAA